MDFFEIAHFLFQITVFVFFLSLIGLIWTLLLYKKQKNPSNRKKRIRKHQKISPSYRKHASRSLEKKLPNGHTRREYHESGFTDADIEIWGLDQPLAPDPDIAPWIIGDMADGNLDGHLDFFDW